MKKSVSKGMESSTRFTDDPPWVSPTKSLGGARLLRRNIALKPQLVPDRKKYHCRQGDQRTYFDDIKFEPEYQLKEWIVTTVMHCTSVRGTSALTLEARSRSLKPISVLRPCRDYSSNWGEQRRNLIARCAMGHLRPGVDSYSEQENARHSVEVTAETLYESHFHRRGGVVSVLRRRGTRVRECGVIFAGSMADIVWWIAYGSTTRRIPR